VSKHTRGPWTDQSVDGSQWGIYGPNGESIGMAHQIKPIPDDLKQVERTANARLMAASPEMADALWVALTFMHHDHPARATIRAALVKALGEQS
jgi:hypothetical protein